MQYFEQLETRRLLASFTAASVADLIADINAANAAGGSNTINLAAGSTFKLTAVDNNNYGPNGLPVIASGDNLTIFGNGAAIGRGTTGGTPAFRFFAVAPGGSLALSDMTLSHGFASYTPTGAWGGGILNQGTLSLDRVTVQSCIAQGEIGGGASGGGIYSSGALTIANSTIQNNQALGGAGTINEFIVRGGAATGGGLYVGGSATVTNTVFSSNLAQGGDASDKQIKKYGRPGNGEGGAIFADGSIQISGSTITNNAARGGSGYNGSGLGIGGGICILSGGLVSLDGFTQAHTTGNSASFSGNDIYGSFTVLS